MPRPISPDVVYHLVTVAEPCIAPDGALVAFVRSSVDRKSMETRSQVMMMDLSQEDAAPFTQGPSDTSPRFSPDGRTLAFLRPDKRGQAQVWLMSLSGGEPRQLTEMPRGVRSYAWSPDSLRLVLVSDDDPDPVPDGHDAAADPRVTVVRRIRYRSDTLGWRGNAHSHLFTIDAARGQVVRITQGDWDDHGPAWSRDGSRIAFISNRREDRDFVPYTEAYTVPSDGGEAVLLSGDLPSVAGITWSPEGDRVALVASDDPAVEAGWQGWVFVIEPDGARRRLTDDRIKPVAGFAPVTSAADLAWTGDGRILFIADSRGESHVYEVSPSGGGVRRIWGGGCQLTSVTWDIQGSSAVVVAASPESSGDLRLVDLQSGSSRRVTGYNDGYHQERPTARLEKLVHSRAGMEIESRLLLPPDHDQGRRHPLVVDIHGGPHGSFYDAFNPVQQVLSTAGYAVLCVNPRGSSTYGVELLKAVLGDWGGQDYLDIMSAVEEVCARPDIDPARLGLHGYSYGGYMSSWIVGHDRRFSAAVVGAPCIHLTSMYGTSDIGVSFGERQWGGRMVDAEEAMRERSPLTYAAHVETPVLLLHGEEDRRCPIEQSEQYFVALKRLGKSVELVRFPGASHGLLRTGHPRLREEYLSRTLAWFDRRLGSPAGGESAREAPPRGGEAARGPLPMDR